MGIKTSQPTDLSRVGVRSGKPSVTTLDSFVTLFFERKLGEGVERRLGLSVWCLMFLVSQAWTSVLPLPEPRAKEEDSLEG